MLKLVIHEPVPSLNRGEAAILGGIVEALRPAGDVDLVLYSPPGWVADDARNYAGTCRVATGADLCDMENAYRDDPIDRGRFYLTRQWGRLVAIGVVSRFSAALASRLAGGDEFFKAFLQADVVLASHDGMLGYACFFPAVAARAMGKPHVLFGGGHDGGSRERPKARRMLQYAVNRAALCTVRDEGTFNYLVSNGIAARKIGLFPDPAVLLPACDGDHARAILLREGVPAHAVNRVCSLIPVQGGIVARRSFRNAASDAERRERRVALWASIVEGFIGNSDAHFVFLPHCTGPGVGNDDRVMSRDVVNRLPSDLRARVTPIENDYSASDLKGVMAASQFVLGERTHALIGALSAGTPSMALAVQRDHRMHDIVTGMFGRVVLDLDDPDPDQVLQAVLSEWAGRAEAAPAVQARARRVRDEGWKAAAMLRAACGRG